MHMTMIAVAAFAAATQASAEPAATYPPQAPLRAVRFAPNKPQFARLGPVGPYYPERAAARGVNGAAVIDCIVSGAGALDGCVLVSETPAGLDFGVAALRMAQMRWITAEPLKAGEAPAGETARFMVPFQLAGRAKALR